MKTYKYIIIIILVSLFGCKDRSSRSDDFRIESNSDVSIFDFFTEIEIVPLETNERSVLNRCDKILYTGQHYYILDIKQKAIFIFNNSGNLLNKLQRVGNGPGEFLDINDFEINPFNGNLELLSLMGKISVYNTNLEFIQSIDISKYSRATHYFKVVTEDIIVFYQQFELNRLMFYSRKQDKVLKQLEEVPLFIARQTMLNPIYSPFFGINKKSFFYEVFTNKIYEINNLSIEPIFSWDFGASNMNINDLDPHKSFTYYLDYFASSKLAYYFAYNLITDKYYFTSIIYDKKYKTVIYDKGNNHFYSFFNFKEEVGLPHLFKFEKGVFGVVEPIRINNFINKHLIDSLGKNRVQKIKIEDNPVIVKYYFKN